MKPALTFRRKADGTGPEFSVTMAVQDRLPERAVGDIETLLGKYKPLRSYLSAVANSDEAVATCSPTTNFQPNVHYRLIRITDKQFELAKQIAAHAEGVHAKHVAGDHAGAVAAYAAFTTFLDSQRDALIGEFRTVDFSDAVASYGASRLAVPDVAVPDEDCSGMVIFVVVEIFLT